MQLAPRRDAVDLSEETVASRELFLGGVFEVREALLHDRWRAENVPLLSQVAAPAGTRADELISPSLSAYKTAATASEKQDRTSDADVSLKTFRAPKSSIDQRIFSGFGVNIRILLEYRLTSRHVLNLLSDD